MNNLSHLIPPSIAEGHRFAKSAAWGPSIADTLPYAIDARGEDGNPKHFLRKGANSDYYELPGLPDYVIRVNRHVLDSLKIDTFLKNYSSLTPMHHLITGANIGQTLLSSKDNILSIQRQQPGIPLSEHLRKTVLAGGLKASLPLAERTNIRAKAYTKVMQDILDMGSAYNHDDPAQPMNPFVPLFEQAYQLAHLGYEPNFYLDSFFIDVDAKKLGLVNQLSKHTSREGRDDISIKAALETQISRILSELKIECLPVDPDCDQYRQTLHAFESLLSNAKDHVLYNYKPDVAPCLAFAKVDANEMVALSNPSHLLQYHLRNLQESPARPAIYH